MCEKILNGFACFILFFCVCVCFCFDYVYFGSSSLYKNRSFVFFCFYLFCFFFLCKLQSINFIDISKFIPELSLQRTFLVSKKLSFFILHFAQNCFFFYFLHFAQNSFLFFNFILSRSDAAPVFIFVCIFCTALLFILFWCFLFFVERE